MVRGFGVESADFDEFHDYIRWKVRSGQRVRSCMEEWREGGTPEQCFPMIYPLAHYKEVPIAESLLSL